MLQILRRAAPAALAALCLASMALAPTAALAAPLKWAPPVLVNPITVSVQPGNFQYWCHNPASDVRLVWPSTRHVGFVTVANPSTF